MSIKCLKMLKFEIKCRKSEEPILKQVNMFLGVIFALEHDFAT